MKVRHVTEEESFNILKPYLSTGYKFIKWRDHMPYHYNKFGGGVFRFTINMMSLDLLINIMEHDQVENVYFVAVAAPPGEGLDGISMNYKIYVKYHPITEEE